jgi:hypothetical protein
VAAAGYAAEIRTGGSEVVLMNPFWAAHDDVTAWTTHDGPGRPPAGPSPRWTAGLASAWAGYAVLAIIGCAVIHDGGTAHLDLPVWQDVLGVMVLLALPVTIWGLARGSEAGAWLSVVVGAGAAVVSLSQLPLVPWYTVLEATGFALLGLVGLVLAVRMRTARRWRPTGLPDAPAISGAGVAPAAAPTSPVPERETAPASR